MDLLTMQELHSRANQIREQLSDIAGVLMAPGCADDKVGKERAKLYNALRKAEEAIDKVQWKMSW